METKNRAEDVKKLLNPEKRKKFLLYLKINQVEAVKKWAEDLGLSGHSILIDEMISWGLEELQRMKEAGELDTPEMKAEIEELKKKEMESKK